MKRRLWARELLVKRSRNKRHFIVEDISDG
jgi:hypothetical protein